MKSANQRPINVVNDGADLVWYLISPSNEAESQNVRIPANNHNHDHTGFGQIVQPPDKCKRASNVTQLRRCVSSGSGWTNRGCDIEMWIPIVILPEVDHGFRLKVWQSVVMCPKWLHTVIHLNVEYKGITTWHSYADQVLLLKSGIQSSMEWKYHSYCARQTGYFILGGKEQNCPNPIPEIHTTFEEILRPEYSQRRDGMLHVC